MIGPTVKPICLPNLNEIPEGEGFLSGWGYESSKEWATDFRRGEAKWIDGKYISGDIISEYNKLPENLLFVNMTIHKNSECTEKLGSVFKEKMLCAGGNGTDGCAVRKIICFLI